MKKETIHVKVNQTKLPNKMHLEVQKNTRANVFRDRTKYTRKRKHKNSELQGVRVMSLSDWMPKRYVKTHTGKGRNKGPSGGCELIGVVNKILNYFRFAC